MFEYYSLDSRRAILLDGKDITKDVISTEITSQGGKPAQVKLILTPKFIECKIDDLEFKKKGNSIFSEQSPNPKENQVPLLKWLLSKLRKKRFL